MYFGYEVCIKKYHITYTNILFNYQTAFNFNAKNSLVSHDGWKIDRKMRGRLEVNISWNGTLTFSQKKKFITCSRESQKWTGLN